MASTTKLLPPLPSFLPRKPITSRTNTARLESKKFKLIEQALAPIKMSQHNVKKTHSQINILPVAFQEEVEVNDIIEEPTITLDGNKEDPWGPRSAKTDICVDVHNLNATENVSINDEISMLYDDISSKEDGIIRHSSPQPVTKALAKLCGVFPPSKLFHEGLQNLSRVVGLSDKYPWYFYHSSLDEAFSRSINTLLEHYDGSKIVSPFFEFGYTYQEQIERYTPPDILWVLIQTSDRQLMDSLLRVLKIHLEEYKHTQKGVIITLLLRKLQDIRWNSFKGWKSWSETMGLLFTQSGYCLTEEIDIPRITRSEIWSAIGSCSRKRKRVHDDQYDNDDKDEYRKRKRI
ncbi:uncharacterized protein L201_004232 [Kwoniella dendrophila CBS 6074]|uniref:Uncharacterized protein n=1 Tax=Kwoniella dendrophila CBS 6074 TaxID=1295534 RepID=A0AAX4JV21_9TREE